MFIIGLGLVNNHCIGKVSWSSLCRIPTGCLITRIRRSGLLAGMVSPQIRLAFYQTIE